MQKKKTGPVTLPGKKASSKNALATSPKLISQAEKGRYEILITGLTKAYPSDNPLIQLQLVRIARVSIQVERIQNTIDALFEKSRAHSNLEKNLMEFLGVSPEKRIEAILQRNGITSSSSDTDKAINQEIIASKISAPISQQEFLETAPLFCAQLYKKASLEKMTIEEHIENLARTGDNKTDISSQIQIILVDPEDVKKENSCKNLTLEETILETSLSNLKKIVNIKFTEITKNESELKKLQDFEKLLPIEEEATTPNLDQLDKLMRYQTTLQRQLSTCIGELLALNKSDIQNIFKNN
jgi:hypothetical protein